MAPSGIKDTAMITAAAKRKLFFVAVTIAAAVSLALALNWPRADALTAALQPLISQQNTDQSRVARAILDNYVETRSNAAKWSGVYWGFTFCAALCSALAGLILKFESIIRNAETKKDIAALLSVGAALLITLSTSGDFQRKWQANRVAASELERMGYALLENKTTDPRAYFSGIGEVLHKRNLTVVGNMENPPRAAKQAVPASASEQ
jgi:uncharacterized membrane protein